jgi:cellulose synthase/poly-beta-1,6-N-acetylglucosamine synthase-like glycosyltransferase
LTEVFLGTAFYRSTFRAQRNPDLVHAGVPVHPFPSRISLQPSRTEKSRISVDESELPSISILIPAHNEALVLDHTLTAITSFEYPADRFEILVVNDASTDTTGEIAEKWASRFANLHVVHLTAAERGGGKGAALNRGVAFARYENVAVYDADNTPAPDALKHLAAQLAKDPNLGAVIGTFRTVNRKRNMLTRMINIEGLSFQWIVQAGRWMLMRVCSLPGTNLVIRRALLESLDGWDENALTEDAELSIRIYEAGTGSSSVCSHVEQEPRSFLPVPQRVRWCAATTSRYQTCPAPAEMRPRRRWHRNAVYDSDILRIFAAIMLSDILFLLGLLGIST